jgi:hypothetical protein
LNISLCTSVKRSLAVYRRYPLEMEHGLILNRLTHLLREGFSSIRRGLDLTLSQRSCYVPHLVLNCWP